MAKNKILSVILLLVGLAFVLGALFSWFDNLTTTEPVGLGKWIFDVMQFLVGTAGAGIGGWLSLRKAKDGSGGGTSTRGNQSPIHSGDGDIVQVEDGNYIKEYYAAPATAPETHDTIGFIPPATAETYVHRGKIEEDVIAFIREGGKGAIVGVHAPGGLGKSELAKQTADLLKDEFDVLWVDVGEKKPQQVVGELLTKCGVQTHPTDSYERLINELHHAYQEHRFLVILDDVRRASLDNLNDLLPPKPCAALITSRIQQMGNVKTFLLDSMNWEQAHTLFKAILGEDVVKLELDTLKALADRCKFNPLAMEIAARRIRQFEGTQKPVARYFENAQAKFSELKMEGDARWNMERIFDISYEDLSVEDRQKFQTLSAFHPTGFSVEAVSFLWKSEPSLSRQTLSRFINLSLVKVVETADEKLERYRLHDLLDEYATAKLKTSGNYNETKTALAQWLIELFDKYYTDDASTAPHVVSEKENLLYICEWARGESRQTLSLCSPQKPETGSMFILPMHGCSGLPGWKPAFSWE